MKTREQDYKVFTYMKFEDGKQDIRYKYNGELFSPNTQRKNYGDLPYGNHNEIRSKAEEDNTVGNMTANTDNHAEVLLDGNYDPEWRCPICKCIGRAEFIIDYSDEYDREFEMMRCECGHEEMVE